MHSIFRVLVIGGLVSGVLPARPADAAGVAFCAAGWIVTLSQGIGMSTAADTFTTEGYPAYLDCAGSVAGEEITGPAEYVESGKIEGNCAGGQGTGTFRASIPTRNGTRVVEGPFDVTWVGPQGYFKGPQFSGYFQFYPVDGDCVGTPARKARVLTQGVLIVS